MQNRPLQASLSFQAKNNLDEPASIDLNRSAYTFLRCPASPPKPSESTVFQSQPFIPYYSHFHSKKDPYQQKLSQTSVSALSDPKSRSRDKDTKHMKSKRHKDHKHKNIDHSLDKDDQIYFKIKLCPDYLRGSCKKGISCKYAHGEHELRGLPSFHKTSLCRRFLKGECPNQKIDCKYAHGTDDLRQVLEQKSIKSGSLNQKGKGTNTSIPKQNSKSKKVTKFNPPDSEKNKAKTQLLNSKYQLNQMPAPLIQPTSSPYLLDYQSYYNYPTTGYGLPQLYMPTPEPINPFQNYSMNSQPYLYSHPMHQFSQPYNIVDHRGSKTSEPN